ncbi:MAG: ABC transporter ATP-binding protein [Treponema sp.]|jgi:ABC-type Fe3+/spermidine/putrescine transport system ATPase subunit|nr:ABC transporter ATP-binding protein [Treponema sp.]
MLELKGVKKSFDSFTLDINLEVADGETLALIGPSGCGKTTVLNLIAGLAEAQEGKILIDKEDAGALAPWKRRVSMVFQDIALFPHLDVGKNVAYGLFIRGVSKAERRRVTAEVLKTVRLSGYERRRVDTLSGGERQRVAIARALASDPRALLLDEPFSALDTPLRRELWREFPDIRARSNAPGIFVTHDREEAATLGDRIALMDAGRVIESGAARELFLAPKTEFGARFLGAGSVIPCMVEGNSGDRVMVNCSFGRLAVPRGSMYDEERPLLFIPHDALSLTRQSDLSFSALVRKSVFEGERRIVELELPDGLRINAKTSPRTEVPAQDACQRWFINTVLLRFVRNSSGSSAATLHTGI